MDDFDLRVTRDQLNALTAQRLATAKSGGPTYFRISGGFASGASAAQLSIRETLTASQESLRAISARPFDAMLEASVETTSGEHHQLWYINERTTTSEFFGDASERVHILPWTHPAVQIALSSDLGTRRSITTTNYPMRSIKPLARARFQQILPKISGLYEPGGRTRDDASSPATPDSRTLKAVKLDMTADQVEAFTSRMDGFLMISGAPGTGKTTVAFQRIRYLYDQQDVSGTEPDFYKPARTRVFLANRHLISYSRELLTSQLGIPGDVVTHIADFIRDYLNSKWTHKRNARLRSRDIPDAEARAREAFFNLCKPSDLRKLWATYEKNIYDRLHKATQADWFSKSSIPENNTLGLAQELSVALRKPAHFGNDPLSSRFTMDAVFDRCRTEYEAVRAALTDRSKAAFDASFARWLYSVYDPLDTVATYFSDNRYEGFVRIKNGTGAIIDPATIFGRISHDWSGDLRQYGPEEAAWLAWLLRFGLPRRATASERFHDVPTYRPTQERSWSHVVIDEAQDLSVQEASLLASLVHFNGSLTVSADFRQIVSPVHGMENAEALTVGLAIKDDMGSYTSFPFRQNMRQGRNIGLFLRAFYQHVFHEFPPFDAGNGSAGKKPILYSGSSALFPRTIAQMMNIFKASPTIRSVAVLQVDEDTFALERFREALKAEGVITTSLDDPTGSERALILTTVERAKGLEFDACIVIGLDGVDRASLNYSQNRAYVALSRATQRLFIFSEHVPLLFRAIPPALYEHRPLQ